MATILGVNALFHDPAAALVIDGAIVAAAEEERFSRRRHGHPPVPFAAWELPELAARWCLEEAGITAADLDAVTYSYDPELAAPADVLGLDDPWDHLRQTYAREAPAFLADALPGLDPAAVRFVPHLVAHAASGALASPFVPDEPDGGIDVLVLDGRGESASHLAGTYHGAELTVLAAQRLPHALGLLLEEVTAHLGFRRSSDEHRVAAMASYGAPRFLDDLRERVRVDGEGGFRTLPVDWGALAKRLEPGDDWTDEHADLAASVQARVEEVVVDLARWLRARSGSRRLALAGGVALNSVVNTRVHELAGYDDLWVQPAAGDAGTALGGALHVAAQAGDVIRSMGGAALGRGWTDHEIELELRAAQVPYERPADVAEAVAEVLAEDGIVAWFQGRSELGPRALGHRSLLAHPGRHANLGRLSDVTGREQFRQVAPMVLTERASEVFGRGPLPSPYPLFVHDVAPEWRMRIPAVVHVDGTARAQTVDAEDEPLVARMLRAFERRTGLPAVASTGFDTACRPTVDDPRDALEHFGSAPVTMLAIGPYVVRRPPVGGSSSSR